MNFRFGGSCSQRAQGFFSSKGWKKNMYAVREEEDEVPSRVGKHMWSSLRKNNDEGQYEKMGEGVERVCRVRPATMEIQGTDRVQSFKIRIDVLSAGARAHVLIGPKAACGV